MSGVFNWRNASIRTKILIPMLVLGLIPVFSVGMYAMVSNNTSRDISTTAVDQHVRDHFHGLMAEKTQQINDFFESREHDLHLALTSHFLMEGLEIFLGHEEGNATHEGENLNQFFEDTIEQYDAYSRIMIIAPNGTVVLYQISAEEKAKAIARGESYDDLGEDYSDKQYFKDAWKIENRDDHVFTDAFASEEISQDSEDVTISQVYVDTHGEGALASLHYSMDLDMVFDMLVYKDEDGNADLEEYEERGLGATGEQYLVQADTKLLYSPERAHTGREGVLEHSVATLGVNKALEQGMYYGQYENSEGEEVVGISWNFQESITGTDARHAEDVDRRCSFNLPWIYVLEMTEAEIHASINEIEAQNQDVFTVLVASLIVSALAIFIIGGLIANTISKGTISLSKTMEKASIGDLTVDAEEIETLGKISSGKDEVGVLGASFVALKRNLIDMIGATQITSLILQSSAEELQSGTEEINASAEEVASTSQAMSNGATTQTELINEISEDIKQTTKLVDEIISSIRNNTNQVSQIALQTNILALNAGIEASRAGDYGRGFAVVAENIRKLSDQSKVASETIGEVADEIAARLEEAFNKISSTMLNVVSVSEETAASAEEVAAAAEEMTATIEEIATAAQELTTQAEESVEQIGKFKIEKK